MPIEFDDDGSPAAINPATPFLSPRQEALLQYYNALRPYEQTEFCFVIKTIRGLFPKAQCEAIALHTGGPIAPGDQADLSWGRLTNTARNSLQNVQNWVCRLIIFGDKDGGFPTRPKFDLPQDNHFLSFTRRIAFPIRLYNRASGLPILIRGDGWYERERDGSLKKKKNGSLVRQVGIERGTSFSPYFCESDFSSKDQFAEFLKRWLDQDVLDADPTPLAPIQGPGNGPIGRGPIGGAVRVGVAAGRAVTRAGAAMNKSKVQTKTSEAKEAPKALETPQPRHANEATSAHPKPQQLPAPSPEKGDSVEGRHSADAAPGTPSPKWPQSSKE